MGRGRPDPTTTQDGRTQLSSLADETPKGRSIVVFAKQAYGLRERSQGELRDATIVPFTAQTRMSGVDLSTPDGARQVRKGAASAVISWVREHGGTIPPRTCELVDGISASGGTPLLVGELVGGTARVLGIIQLTDVVKQGMRQRFDEMRRMGIRAVMITGDNPLTARAIADEAGVERARPADQPGVRGPAGGPGGEGPDRAADRVRQLVRDNTVGRSLGFLGEPGVNVLELNLDLDRVAPIAP